MSFIGINEALLVGAIILALIIGPKKLPELARSLGESKKAFKDSLDDSEDSDTEEKSEDE